MGLWAVCMDTEVQRHVLADDNFDDNHDDNRSQDHYRYRVETSASCLVTRSAWSWQCGGQVFVFIRSASATPFGLPALNPQNRSSSSDLISANVSLLTSPQPEKRKVGGSIPPLATTRSA